MTQLPILLKNSNDTNIFAYTQRKGGTREEKCLQVPPYFR